MSDKKKKYWLSLDEWKKDKPFQELLKKEFVTPPFAPEDGKWDRRDFLKLMGASLALTSFGCLRRPAEKIVPYAHRPEDVVIGQSNFYASSYFDQGEGFGLIVQTRQGRPIKAEGNPQHPINQGGMSARAHSHLLSLYDPERLKTAKRNLFNKKKINKETITAYLDEADPVISSAFKKGKTALLTDYFPSPASFELIKEFSKTYNMEHFGWSPCEKTMIANSYKKCFGKALVPTYHFDKAQMIVSIQCDFLGTFLSPVEHSKRFSSSRKPTKDMSRLVVFESLLSLTGTNADDRYRIKPSDSLAVMTNLVTEVLKLKSTHPSIQRHLLNQQNRLSIPHQSAIQKIAKDLVKNSKQSLVVTGGLESQTADSESLLILAHFLNYILQNDGITIDYKNHYTSWSQSLSSVSQLINQLNKKEIKNVVIHRTNPMYSYPDQEKLSKALRKADLVVYTGDRMDETAQISDYIIPDLHDLEKWQEWEFQKGLHSIQQPTIRPLIQSRTFEYNLITWIRYQNKNAFSGISSWYDYLKKSAKRRNLSWSTLLQKGFQQKRFNFSKMYFNTSVLKKIKLQKHKLSSFELTLYSTAGLKDGSLANVSWLQEFPDPVTKICWDNYLCVSPQDAENHQLKEGQIVHLDSQNKLLKVPVHIQPGQSDGVLGLAIGYGRTKAGEVGNHVGVNAFSLLSFSKKNHIFSGLTASIQPTKQHVPLAVVQGHHSMEGRQIVVETTLQKYLKNPASDIHKHKVFSLWSEHKYPREKWAMVIDLNSCTGCGACVVACQSENNIPVVGKKYVLEGREMHWMRVDRYYQGSPKKIESVVHQPVVCMHCENAPCETVCPVAATVHSDEGTNDMIYNRCVGTRYCSNNCPYKVRRFNWFNYEKNIQTAGALNPDVSVRSRGVMEKCTFCIHRIKQKQSEARLSGQVLKDGDLQTACQQSCPSNAIVFGNYNDKNSRVRKAFDQANAYSLLEELNTKPSVRYRTKIRNTQRQMMYKNKKGHH